MNQVYNVAVGDRTTSNQLFDLIHTGLVQKLPHLHGYSPTFSDFRAGDVRYSLADISKARELQSVRSPDETQWNPGVVMAVSPDSTAFHPGYIRKSGLSM